MCNSTGSNARSEDHGTVVHREFVGMLFSLAIAAVAERSATLVYSGVSHYELIPAYAHLVLATVLITSSWVGWSRSEDSMSPIENIFSKDFLELCIDLLLVTFYFFVVFGVEKPDEETKSFTPSIVSESLWIFVVFVTYAVWDLLTKCPFRGLTWASSSKYRQRGWASFSCAVLAAIAYCVFRDMESSCASVVLGDAALLVVVVLFRLMKLRNWSEHPAKNRLVMVTLAIVFGVLCQLSSGSD